MEVEVATSQIKEICRRLHARNLLAAADGNVSVRLNDGSILITPTGVNKGFLGAEPLARVSLDNQILSGHPSGERLMHLEIYRSVPGARAVVHAYPPTAIALSVAKPDLLQLPVESISELILAVGSVPIIPFQRPGTQQMGSALLPFLPQNRVFILGRHGGLSWGDSLDEAYNGMERLEHSCEILLKAHQFGGWTSLPAAEVQFLYDLRKKIGPRTL